MNHYRIYYGIAFDGMVPKYKDKVDVWADSIRVDGDTLTFHRDVKFQDGTPGNFMPIAGYQKWLHWDLVEEGRQ